MGSLIQGHGSLEGKTKALENFHSFGLGDSASSSILDYLFTPSVVLFYSAKVFYFDGVQIIFSFVSSIFIFMKPLPNPEFYAVHGVTQSDMTEEFYTSGSL